MLAISSPVVCTVACPFIRCYAICMYCSMSDLIQVKCSISVGSLPNNSPGIKAAVNSGFCSKPLQITIFYVGRPGTVFLDMGKLQVFRETQFFLIPEFLLLIHVSVIITHQLLIVRREIDFFKTGLHSGLFRFPCLFS